MDVNDLKELFAEVNKRMTAALEHVRHELSGVRTGRASVTILDSVHVEAYGSRMPLNQLAGLSVPEPTLIVAQPFDPSQIAAIEKAIRASDLGLNPANDGKVVRIPIPALTEERRKELSRHVHKLAEEGRNAVRQVRRDANDRLKKLLKDHRSRKTTRRRASTRSRRSPTPTSGRSTTCRRRKTRNCSGTDGRFGGLVAERHAERLRRQQQIEVGRHGLRLPHHLVERHGRRCPVARRRPSCRTPASESARPPCRRTGWRARDRSWSARRRAAGVRAPPSASPCPCRRASASHTCAPMPPSRSTCPGPASSSSDSWPPFGYAPSATTTMLNRAPHRSRSQQPLGDQGDVERNLRNQNRVGAAGDAGVQRDPAGVAPHHFGHHDPAVRLGRRVQPVDGIGGEGHRRVEAETVGRADDVVVDGLRDADQRDAASGRTGGRSPASRRRR